MKGAGHTSRGLIALAFAAAALSLPAPAGAETTGERVYFRELATSSKPEVETFFSEGGLRLRGSCATDVSTVDFTLQAATTVDNVQVYFNGQQDGTSAAYEADGFDTMDGVGITDFLNMDENAVGQIVYSRPDGRHVTVHWYALEDPLFDPDRCLFVGSAQVAKPGPGGPLSRERIDFRADAGTPRETILDARGLELNARCTDTSSLVVEARTATDHATIHTNSQHVTGVGTDDPYYADDNDFRPGERLNLTNAILAHDSNGGQIVYATPGGAVVTADWGAEEGAYGEADRDCAFYGSARSLGPDAADRFDYRGAAGSPREKFYDRGGVRLRGRCGNPASLFVDLVIGAPLHFGNAIQLAPDAIDASSFGATKLGASALAVNSVDRAAGHAVYVDANRDVHTFDWLGEELNAFGGGPDCAFLGSAEYFPRP